ncbi:TonB-dependent receptor domain-containing protein [Luteimonas sp. SDU101]|uniref:TonB-dependent receptor domain-containing protein n=1 Tax=unclassified Luteimonas TaxID=2629088 RepID=UPI003EB77CE0
MGKNTLRIAILHGILLAGGAMAAPSEVQAQGHVQVFRIGAGDLESVLSRFGSQSRLQLIYAPGLLEGKHSKGLTGTHTPAEALQQLLEDTGLQFERVNDATVVIKRTPAPVPPPASGSAAREPDAALQPASGEVQSLDSITVTGSRIRGGTTPSPVVTIGGERFREEGFSDLGEVIRRVPQNFGGGQNPGVAAGATAGAGGVANQNITGGSSLNLRGLGADATLTLLNGRRMAYGGFAQAVDIDAIPIDAVDRVEIVADGASAIYGSDAVGGVGNVILKRDYDGVALGAQHGRTADGGLQSRAYTATAGTAWSSGGLIATYKHATVDPIDARERDYTAHMPVPTTIYPGSRLRSGLFSGYQALGDRVELKLDALRTEREQRSYAYFSGISSYYSRFSPVTTTTLVAPSIEIAMDGDWQLAIAGASGRDRRVQREQMIMVGTGQVSPSPYDDCYCNESRAHEIGAEGPLFALAGGDARIALGLGRRENEFLQRNLVSGEVLIQGVEGSRFAYAELSLPLMSAGTAQASSPRMTMTAAVRRETYDSFGGVATPKLGLVYTPTGDYTLKASWGRSFKAPTLLQQHQARNALLYPVAVFGGSAASDATVLAVFGGNPQLDAERARTWTASVALHPRALAGLDAELTVFDIDYTDRVVQPIGNYAEALTNPVYAPFVDQAPTSDEQARIIDASAGFYNYTGVDYDPARVSALLYANFVNVARERIRGVDLSASYGIYVGTGRLTLRGSGSWLDSSRENSPADRAFDLSGTLYSPAKVNGRIGIAWQQGALGASLFANYTSGVTSLADDLRTASFTTADLAIRYAFDGPADPRSGWDVAVSAHNLFNRAPPLHRTVDPTWVPYDSTNYSGVGRLVNLSVTRRF